MTVCAYSQCAKEFPPHKKTNGAMQLCCPGTKCGNLRVAELRRGIKQRFLHQSRSGSDKILIPGGCEV